MTAPATSIDALAYQRDGYTVVRDVFDPKEVAEWRVRAGAAAEDARSRGCVLRPVQDKVLPVQDLLSLPELGSVVFDERILRIARTLLGQDEIVYFGDSGMQVGGYLGSFHKDNTCRTDGKHEDWRSPYTLVRLGVYLQDHSRHSGGLKLRRGSHLFADVSSGRVVNVDSRIGDVVAWSLRITHSGHAIRVRGARWLALPPVLELHVPKRLVVPEACQRIALFVTFGLSDAHLERYLAKYTDLAKNPDNYLHKAWLYADPSPAWEERARACGVVLRKPIREWGTLFDRRGAEAGPGYVETAAGPPDAYPPDPTETVVRAVAKMARTVFPKAS